MTVALVIDFAGGTRQQYDQTVERMHLDGHMAPGGLMHFAGSYGGGWRVIDLWQDLQAFERFRDEEIIPHSTAVGLGPPSNVRVLEVDEDKGGNAQPSQLVQCVLLPGLDRDAFHVADAKVLAAGLPAEITFHVNGPLNDGWCVIDGWTSKEARDRVAETVIRPAFDGVPLTGEPIFEDLIVQASMGASAAAPAR